MMLEPAEDCAMDGLVNNGSPFHCRAAAMLGFTPKQLRLAVRGQILRRPLHSVYIDNRVLDTREVRLACLVLVMPEHAVVWGRTAAWLWGIDAFAPDEQLLLVPECIVPHHQGRPAYADVRVVEGYLAPDAITNMGGVRVTTALRTALDLARRLPRPMALAALDAFAHARLVTLVDLKAGLRLLRHHPGIRQARELVALTEPATESVGESWLRLRIIDAGFPHPEPQIRLYDRGVERYRLDLGFRSLRIGLEYDGELYHGALDQRTHDEQRRMMIKRDFGYDVFSFGRGDVLGRVPTVELTVGELLSLEPQLPRRW